MDAHTMEQPTPAAAGTGATAIVVDDEPIVREVVAQLRRLQSAHERRRAEFEQQIAALPEGAGPYLAIALRKGVHAQTAFAAWCQEAIDELDGGGGGSP